MADELFDINAEIASEPGQNSVLQTPARNSDGTFAPRTEAPSAVSAQPARTTHPGWLLRQAAEVGIGAEEAAEMDQQTLGTTVTHLWRNHLQMQQENARLRTVQEGQVRTPPPVEEDIAVDWGVDPETGRPFLDTDIHPAIAKGVKSLGNAQAKRIKELEAKLGKFEQSQQQAAQSREHEKIDSAFAECGLEKIFGKGSIEELPESSPQRKRRLAVFVAAGLKVGELPRKAEMVAKLKEASEALFGGAAPAADPYAAPVAPGRPSAQDWQNGGLARPTQRSGAAEPKGDELAVRNLEAKMRAQGGSLQVGDQEILNGIPD